MLLIGVFTLYLTKNTQFFKVAVYRAARHLSNGRRISCKKRESRTAFEFRRQLNSHVGRRCAPDDRRMFRRPLNGRAASVQLPLNLHCRKGNVRLKRVLCAYLDSLFAAISYTSLPSRTEITTIFMILSKASCSSL